MNDNCFKQTLPEVMFPVFWFDTSTELPESLASQLSLLLLLPSMMQVRGDKGAELTDAVLVARPLE